MITMVPSLALHVLTDELTDRH